MNTQIVRIFDNYDAAQRARAELIASGFADERVQLKVKQDEAGPAKSNFTVGNDPNVVGGQAYSRTYAPTNQVEYFMMTVLANDPGEAEGAASIMARHGATSGDPVQQPPRR